MKGLFQLRYCDDWKRSKLKTRQTIPGEWYSEQFLMAKHGDWIRSANTHRKSISRVQEKSAELSLIYWCRMNPRTRKSFYESRCNQMTELGESRRFDLGVWRSKVSGTTITWCERFERWILFNRCSRRLYIGANDARWRWISRNRSKSRATVTSRDKVIGCSEWQWLINWADESSKSFDNIFTS